MIFIEMEQADQPSISLGGPCPMSNLERRVDRRKCFEGDNIRSIAVQNLGEPSEKITSTKISAL